MLQKSMRHSSEYCRAQFGPVQGHFDMKSGNPSHISDIYLYIWCPRQDSNLRPSVPETGALSPELRRQTSVRLAAEHHPETIGR